VTSTTQDRHAATTVLDLVPTALVPDGTRLYPVGRLDQDSEGLLLLTNDGDWAERVLHPRFGVAREYAVGLAVPLDREQERLLEAGIPLDEGRARLAAPLRRLPLDQVADLVRVLQPAADPRLTWYRATLRQGWKRQLRRMFGAAGAPIERLVRISIGPVRLGDLRSGRARRVTQREIAALRTSAGDAGDQREDQPPPRSSRRVRTRR
jgi:23S rRNA pseudouridine2605 synthase